MRLAVEDKTKFALKIDIFLQPFWLLLREQGSLGLAKRKKK